METENISILILAVLYLMAFLLVMAETRIISNSREILKHLRELDEIYDKQVEEQTAYIKAIREYASLLSAYCEEEAKLHQSLASENLNHANEEDEE